MRENDRLCLVHIYMGFSILGKDMQLFNSLLESTDQGLRYYNLCRSCSVARMNQAVITTYKNALGDLYFYNSFKQIMDKINVRKSSKAYLHTHKPVFGKEQTYAWFQGSIFHAFCS